LPVPAQRQRPARDAFVQISWQEVRIQPPVNGAVLSKTEVKVWVVRVWEPEPPDGREALEWILVTTVPILCEEDAWERVKWYKWVRHEVVHVAVERENDDSTRCSAIGTLPRHAVEVIRLCEALGTMYPRSFRTAINL